jgi:hypothetical protein
MDSARFTDIGLEILPEWAARSSPPCISNHLDQLKRAFEGGA